MNKLLLMMMATVCLTMTAHAESESFAHVLNDGRDLTLDTPGDISKADLYSLLKSIATEETVRLSRTQRNLSSQAGKKFTYFCPLPPR
jgi:hypothetical protein